MTETINQWFTQAWSNIWFYASFQFVDPIWWWAFAVAFYVIVVTALLALYRFYFGTLPDWLQKLFGLSVFAAIGALFVYRKGENDARAHDADNKPKEEQPKERPWWNTHR